MNLLQHVGTGEIRMRITQMLVNVRRGQAGPLGDLHIQAAQLASMTTKRDSSGLWEHDLALLLPKRMISVIFRINFLDLIRVISLGSAELASVHNSIITQRSVVLSSDRQRLTSAADGCIWVMSAVTSV